MGSKDWVLGGIEKHTRLTELKKFYFAVIVEDRTHSKIEPIFCQYIHEGIIVSSDFLKAYNWMGEKGSGYTHLKVSAVPPLNFFSPSQCTGQSQLTL